jgi:putative Holliday junction resolvase
MKYIGIDYGSKRVGVAVSDDTGTLAFPKKVIKNSGAYAVVKEIRDLSVAENADEIVIGDSRDYHGRPNEIMKEIEAFSVLLQEEIKLPVHFQLEFMSSAQATRASSGGKPEGRMKKAMEGLKGDATLLDASAAAVILQSFLDKKKA